MSRPSQALLWASCILIGIGAYDVAQSRDRGVSASVGGKNGINADVSVGTNKGLDAGVTASVGGRKGVNANVDANVGNNIGADVDASVGGNKGITANVDANTGKSIDADVNASVGGLNGVNTRVGVTVNGVDPNPGVVNPDNPDVTSKNPKPDQDDTTLTPAQLQAFNAMPDSEKKVLLKRCLSVGAGGYDPALVNLCKLLRLSASR